MRTPVVALAAAAQLCAAACAARAEAGAAAPPDAPMRVAQAEASRDTEQVLRKVIGELQEGKPDYAAFEAPLQQAIRQQLPAMVQLLKQLGSLKRIAPMGKQNGADIYRVEFENGITTWAIAIAPSGKIAGLFFRPSPAAERSGDDVTVAGLSGTLLKPAGVAHPPVVLLIAGSGPTDRNGNQNGAGPAALRQVAEVLAAQGIASLRYDKRGIARSAAVREEDLTFAALVNDAGAWLTWLRARNDLGPVFVAGHSEGGVIAIELANELAKTAPPVGLVLLATPGRRLGDVLREQLRASGLETSLLDEALRVLAALERGESVATVSPPLLSLFRPSVQPYLRSQLAIDPAADLHALSLPVLIVSGGHDIQVSAEDAALLAKARPDARRLDVAEMNHVLKIAPADRGGQQKAYTDPSLPLAPDLMPGIVAFVTQTARGR